MCVYIKRRAKKYKKEGENIYNIFSKNHEKCLYPTKRMNWNEVWGEREKINKYVI